MSIVVPIFCEEKNIKRIYGRLEDVTKGALECTWKYIFVNDGKPLITMIRWKIFLKHNMEWI